MIRIISALLLAITGAGAVYGGILLITDPTGWKLGLNTSILQHSPFTDFFVPGVILLVVLGFGSLLVAALAIIKTQRYATWIIFMGFIIAGWISVQILMLHDVQLLHIIFAFVGIVLTVFGIVERKREYEG